VADLFRSEALRRDRPLPSALLFGRRETNAALVVIVLGVAFLAVWASLAKFSVRVPATGVIESTTGVIKVSSEAGGYVSELKVTEGQRVSAGQVLLVIRQSDNANAQIADELQGQLSLLSANVADGRSKSDVLARQATIRINAIKADIASLATSTGLADKRLTLAQRKLDGQQQLWHAGFISEAGMQDQKLAVLAEQGALQTLKQQLAAKEADLKVAEQDLARTQLESRQVIAQARSAQSEVAQRIVGAQHSQEKQIVAQVAGTVTALQASVGQEISSRKPLMALIPAGGAIQARLYVPSSAVGSVEAAQRVQFSVDAYPSSRYGFQAGTVSHVSSSPFMPDEVEAPLQATEPVYPVTVTLAAASISAYGHSRPLVPGMKVSADIVVNRLTAWEWLFNPLLAAKGRISG